MTERIVSFLVASVAVAVMVIPLRAQTPVGGAQLNNLNTLVKKLEENGWDSDGDGTGDKGIVDVLFIGAGDPLNGELQAELTAAGLAMNDKTKKCVKGALEGLKKAAEGDPDGEDQDGKKKRKSRVVISGSLKGPLDADCTPNEVSTKGNKTSQKHTTEKCTKRQRIRISAAGAQGLNHSLGFMGPVLMHEGKRTCQGLTIDDTANMSAAEKAKQKELDCEAVNTQILIWIAWKMVTKDRSEPPPEQQPKPHRFACKMLEDAKKAKKKVQ